MFYLNTGENSENVLPPVSSITEPSEPEPMEFINVDTCIASETPDDVPQPLAQLQSQVHSQPQPTAAPNSGAHFQATTIQEK